MATQISLHTLVSFVMIPRRTRAVHRLILLGELDSLGYLFSTMHRDISNCIVSTHNHRWLIFQFKAAIYVHVSGVDL